IKPEKIAAIREGRRPEAMSADEAIIYDFASELLHNKGVSDATFQAAEKRFGKPAVVDLVGIVGYYTFNAMMLNTARYRPKDGTVLPHFPQWLSHLGLEQDVTHDRRLEHLLMPGAGRKDHNIAGMHQQALAALDRLAIEFAGSHLFFVGGVAAIVQQDRAFLDDQLGVPAHMPF